MKNKYDNYEILTDFDVLYRAYKKARSGTRWKDGTAIYCMRALECTLALKEMMEEERFKTKVRRTFYIYEPKKRLIVASEFYEKVAQRALCDEILKPALMPKVISDNYASQEGKGTHYGLYRLEEQLRHFYRRHGTNGFILKGDIRHYFPSTDHETLKNIYREYFEDERLLKFIDTIIDSWKDEEESDENHDRGVPLGFDLSQISGVYILSKLDHYIKDECGIKYYGRYMDDFFVIAETKAKLYGILNDIKRIIGEMGYSVNEKTAVFPISAGIDFLGFHTYITETGKVIRKIRAKSKNRERRKLKRLKGLMEKEDSKIGFEDVRVSYQAWRAHAAHGNCYYLISKMDTYFDDLFKDYIKGDQTKAFSGKPIKTKRR